MEIYKKEITQYINSMKQAVYKYQIKITDYQDVTLHKGAKILCIKNQTGKICIWALVNPDETEQETIKLRCAGTGHLIEEDVEYIDTVFVYNGDLVFHFFKIK